jgi:hypothetical protein
MRRRMTRTRDVAAFGFAVLLGLAALAPGAAQEKPAAAPATAPRPGAAEMERLKFYLGEWDYTESYPKNGGQNTGIYTSKLGPGGNSLVQSFHSHGPMGDFEGLLVITWDPKEKAYKSYVFGNDFPGCIVETGRFEGDELVFRGEMTMGGKHLAMRNSTRLPSPGRIVSEEFLSVDGGAEKLLVHVDAKKR